MPPKKPTPATGAKKPVAAKAISKPGVGTGKGSTKPAAVGNKKAVSNSKATATAAVKTTEKPPVKKWTEQDEAAKKIQKLVRGFLGRVTFTKMKKEKQEYEDLMDKLEREACIAIAKQRQAEAEEEARKEAEERQRKAEQRKRVKRMLEAAFDGDLDEINTILKEVRELDDKMNVGHDIVGDAIRMRHFMDIIDCEDAHGHTPLSEAASGGHAETVKYLIDQGADPNSRGQFERTPLYRSAFSGHLDCCEVLLQSGADPRLYANDGQTPENVASMDAVKEVLSEWDTSMTESLLSKIETEKERRREKEKARRRTEQSELEMEIAEVQKEYDAHQKTLNALYCELNKRIDEHDSAPALGFDKPEITLQSIKDAEDQLEIAKVDYENAKERLRQLHMKQREQMEESIKADGDELPGLQITIKELPDILFRDVGNKIKESGKWPMVIDTSNRTPTFLRYQDTNYINALMPKDMVPEVIRMAVLGAIRYGKPFVFDMMEVDMFETAARIMDDILPNLLNMIMDKSILVEENYLKLVKKEDGHEYLKENFSALRTGNFKFFIITKNIFPSEKLMSSTYPIRIHIPE